MSQKELENTEELEASEEETPEVEPELDDEGNPVEVEEEEIPLFMQEEEEDDDLEASETVPLAALLKQKGKAKDAKEESEQLKARIAELEQAKPEPQTLKRPRSADYDTDEEYEDALEKYDLQIVEQREAKQAQQKQLEQHAQRREVAVGSFIERADKLVAKHKIEPATYADAISAVRSVVEEAFPNMGEAAYPEFLTRLEDGDEATMFTIGRSKKQREVLAQKFREDPSGIKAFRHIARLTERNLGTKPKRSRAPKPAATATGGETTGAGKEWAWRKKYEAAHKDGGGQKALDIKWAARDAGIDTSGW